VSALAGAAENRNPNAAAAAAERNGKREVDIEGSPEAKLSFG
jgi:hypothetical protein